MAVPGFSRLGEDDGVAAAASRRRRLRRTIHEFDGHDAAAVDHQCVGGGVGLAAGAPEYRSDSGAGRTPIHPPPLAREQWILAAGSLASAAAVVVFTVTTVAITNRYLADFYALSAVGLALGSCVIVPLCRQRPIVGAIAGLGALVLTGWSIVGVTLALCIRMVFD